MSLNFSDFISNFSGSSSIDLITLVSNQIGPLETNLNGGGEYYGRYFCLGNLLIQFSDFSQGIEADSSATGSGYYMNYPIAYDDTPYCVILNGYKQENQNFPTNMTITSFSKKKFNFSISSHNGEVCFLVIGPRPASLYTAS